jgi:hypothetical protein
VPDFGPFVSYGAHQLYGKYEFEKEKSSNPAFAQFVEVGCFVIVSCLVEIKLDYLDDRTATGIKKTGTQCLSYKTYNTFGKVSPLARSCPEAYTVG